jgi:hypothetical protein
MKLSDILIHINQNLGQEQQQMLESKLREIEGVIAPRFNQKHLLFVSYNSDRITSFELLKKISSKGYQAQLIGL